MVRVSLRLVFFFVAVAATFTLIPMARVVHVYSNIAVNFRHPTLAATQPAPQHNTEPPPTAAPESKPSYDPTATASMIEPPDVTDHPRFWNPYRPLNRTRRPCTNYLYGKGQWVKDTSLHPPYPSVGEILGCCQRGFEAEHGKGAQRPETMYRWVPSDCDLLPWSEETFCRALRGRDIMFVGDSMNDHWHATLYYLLGGRGDIYRKEGTVRGKRACKTHPVCHKYYPRPLRIYHLTNQLLQQSSRRGRNHKWWKFISPYHLLVLNSGSWMRDPADEDREVSDSEWMGYQRNALRLVRELFNGTVIWRTLFQGHPYCWNYQKPLEKPIAQEDFPNVPPYKRYRWTIIPQRNNFASGLWRDAGAHILDVTHVTNLMPLGHLGKNHPKFKVRNTTDCLHYCAPGMYDTWSLLLMNLLAGNFD